jgi:translation initiation factor 2 beta subunit (eIF-2beta)/eIF-5
MPLINRDRKQTDSHYRYKMPSVEVKHEGSGQYTRTFVINLKKISESLNTTPEFINHFLSVELGTESSCSDNSDNRLFLRGTYQANVLQDHLDKYIKIYVKCIKCNIPEGKLKVKGKNKKKSVWTYCPSCGHQEDVSNSHKTSNFIKNNWDPEKHIEEPEITPEKISKKETKPIHNTSEDTEWSINELEENTQLELNGFQLPGMGIECNGFQLPVSSICTYIPEITKDTDIKTNVEPIPIIECSLEDLEKDYKEVCNLVSDQFKTRRNLLTEKLEPLVLVYKNTSDAKFGDNTLQFIKKCSEKLDLKDEIASVIASCLFDKKIVIDSQIQNYRNLLEPFLNITSSQHHFLNCFLVLVNHDQDLMSDFENIVNTLLTNHLVDNYSLIKWHDSLINSLDDLSNILKINSEIPFNVYQIIDSLVNKIKLSDTLNDNGRSLSLSDGMTFGYQEIKIMHRTHNNDISSSFSSSSQRITINQF